MPVTVTINGTDHSDKVQWRSMKVENILTNQTDTASFEILYDSVSNTYQPTIGQVVSITDDGVTIFEGPITEIDSTPTNYNSLLFTVFCQDYARFLDRKLVINSYSNMTVEAIIQDIVSTYTTGFTTTNTSCTIEIDYIAFNYETVSDCLRQLADIVAYDWYVDNNKDIHFFSKETNTAPYELEDNNGKFIYNSLIIRNDNSQVRNQVYVRGGEYLGSRFTASIEANGVDYIYPLGYRYSEFGVTLTGQVLSVGVDYLDDADDYDVLYNFQEKILRWKDEDKPSAGSEIRAHGLPYLPVIAKISDREAQASIATAEGGDGVYEHVIIDKTIETKAAARDRADAEIERYKNTIVEAEFLTESSGLRAGQLLRLNLTSRGINKQYIISKVKYMGYTPTKMFYEVSLISTKTFGMLDWMQRQIRNERKQIKINEDEILDVIETADATVTITETNTAAAETEIAETGTLDDTFTAYIDSAPTWVAGTYNPTSINDRKRPMFTDRDCDAT